MARVSLQVDMKQVEHLIEELPLKEKIRIAKKLDDETWQVRFKNLLHRIDKRVKKFGPISDEEIVRISKQVRRKIHERSHH